jgi:hypothetical protein
MALKSPTRPFWRRVYGYARANLFDRTCMRAARGADDVTVSGHVANTAEDAAVVAAVRHIKGVREVTDWIDISTTFGQAIRSGFSHYIKFSGRAIQSEYWFWVLFAVLGMIATWTLDGGHLRSSLWREAARRVCPWIIAVVLAVQFHFHCRIAPAEHRCGGAPASRSRSVGLVDAARFLRNRNRRAALLAIVAGHRWYQSVWPRSM